jgi:hypothetical protein
VNKIDIVKLACGGGDYASFNLTEKMFLVLFSITLLEHIKAGLRSSNAGFSYLLDYTAKMTVDHAMHALFIHDLRAGYDLAPVVAGSKVLIKQVSHFSLPFLGKQSSFTFTESMLCKIINFNRL